MMRWKAFIPAAVIVAAVCVIYIFFIDTVIKNVMIKAGQGIFNAKVEIRQVDLRLSKSSLSIRGLAIANKDDPWKNLLEAEHIVFDVQTLPALEKKFIIDKIAAEGVTWGTIRTTSGALPRIEKKKKKEAAASRKKEKKKKEKRFVSLPFEKLQQIGKKIDIKHMIDPNNLAAAKRAKELEGIVADKKTEWDDRVKKLDEFQEKSQKIKQDIEAVKDITVSSVNDIPGAQERIKRLQDARASLSSMKEEINKTKTSIRDDIERVQKNINNLDAFKEKDLQVIMKDLGFGDISAGSIGSALFGPAIVARVTAALGWISRIRAQLPEKKDKVKKPERKRLTGRDILFPKEKGLPGLLITELVFSAASPKTDEKRSGLMLSGSVENITSNPSLLNKPIYINAQGQFADMKSSTLAIKGQLDYTTDISQEKFIVSVSGYDLAGSSWAGGNYLPEGISKGTGGMKFSLSRKQENILCSIDARAADVSFTLRPPADEKDIVQQIMNDAFSSITMLQVQGTITGMPPDDLDMSLSSNLDDVIAKKLKEIFGKELERQKALVEKELDAIVDAKKKELRENVQGSNKELEGKIIGKESSLQKQIDMVNTIIQNKENAVKGVADQKKSEGQEKIKKEFNGQLKKLFK